MKSRLRFPLLAVMAGALVSATLHAASTAPLPSLPLIRKSPAKIQWTIIARKAANEANPVNAAPEANEVERVESIWTDGIGHDRVTFRNGRTQDIWYTERAYLVDAGSEVSICPTKSTGPVLGEDSSITDAARFAPLSFAGFPGVSWIALPYFDKVEAFDGVVCYHYVLNAGQEAWVNVSTSLPVAYRDGNSTYVYQFGAEPDSALVLPDPVKATLDRYLKLEKRRELLKTGH